MVKHKRICSEYLKDFGKNELNIEVKKVLLSLLARALFIRND